MYKGVPDAVGQCAFSSYHKGMPDDGTRSCPTDTSPSSWYGSGPYDYMSGLSDLAFYVVYVANQPLWSGWT